MLDNGDERPGVPGPHVALVEFGHQRARHVVFPLDAQEAALQRRQFAVGHAVAPGPAREVKDVEVGPIEVGADAVVGEPFADVGDIEGAPVVGDEGPSVRSGG